VCHTERLISETVRVCFPETDDNREPLFFRHARFTLSLRFQGQLIAHSAHGRSFATSVVFRQLLLDEVVLVVLHIQVWQVMAAIHGE